MLAELDMDSASIMTGLLHDTVEDTGATLDDLRELFGDEVALLVDGVTKLDKLELRQVLANDPSPKQKQSENLRKLVLAMARDIRVLVVKLVDRLHNMRTLSYVSSVGSRHRKARETLQIYAPLAERIGLYAV
jgi:guanosine-3',5'-bis(diphosphate) 3'-pyrophosphohydrolase